MLEHIDGSQIRVTLTEGQMATLTEALSIVFNTHLISKMTSWHARSLISLQCALHG